MKFRKRFLRKIFIYASTTILIILICIGVYVYHKQPEIIIFPDHVLQGDPLLVEITHTKSTTIESITLASTSGTRLSYRGTPAALFGIDLHAKPGDYTVIINFTNGRTLSTTTTIYKREQESAPLGIPQSLGGNTKASDEAMVRALIAENKTFEHLQTASTSLWTKNFQAPLATFTITDPYGYDRETGSYSIPHKGTDFRAAIGTPVMSINDGIVRVVHAYTDYGNTIVIDHGQGIMSFYLHLSQMKVKLGDTVKRGQVIGLSGQTGYALGPHLHLSIRIDGVSIDPDVFLKLFQ